MIDSLILAKFENLMIAIKEILLIDGLENPLKNKLKNIEKEYDKIKDEMDEIRKKVKSGNKHSA